MLDLVVVDLAGPNKPQTLGGGTLRHGDRGYFLPAVFREAVNKEERWSRRPHEVDTLGGAANREEVEALAIRQWWGVPVRQIHRLAQTEGSGAADYTKLFSPE